VQACLTRNVSIHRLGQKEVKDIYIIIVNHTYDQILYAKATKKMIAQLAGEARTVGNTVEEMEENAEEFITKILGQRCFRKDWVDILSCRHSTSLSEKYMFLICIVSLLFSLGTADEAS